MTNYKYTDVKIAAKGNWLTIITALTSDMDKAVKQIGKHVSCPVHGGKDGFRLFKDADNTGGGICNTCGAKSTGFDLIMWINDWDFKTCLKAIGDYLMLNLNEVKPLQPIKRKYNNINQKTQKAKSYSSEKINQLWNECVSYDNILAAPLFKYFSKRQIEFTHTLNKNDSLRFHPSLDYYDENGKFVSKFPAIVCAIKNTAEQIITLHRTYLNEDGEKAPVGNVKKMMPVPNGKLVSGSAIQLGIPKNILGLAEGLETALSAYKATKIATWSSVNAVLMNKFDPPKQVDTVLIWADKDKSEVGEKVAKQLKERLNKNNVKVIVLLPKLLLGNQKSVDWNDVLRERGVNGFPSIFNIMQVLNYM